MSVKSQIDRLNAVKNRVRTNLVAQGITVPADTMLEAMAEQILSVAGYTPEKGVDYWTAADQESIVQQVITALGTPVFGRVDANNNIILTGELADGTYTLKYEDTEGNAINVGTLDVGVPPDVALTWALGTKLDKSTGAVTETGSTNYAATQFINIVPGRTYTITRNANALTYTSCSICWYDANNAFISATANIFNTNDGITVHQPEIPSGAAKMRLRMFFDGKGSTMADVAAGYSMTQTSGVSPDVALNLKLGKLDKTTGTISGDGTDVTYLYSDLIELLGGYTYTVLFKANCKLNSNVCYWDENGNYLASAYVITGVNQPAEDVAVKIAVPDGAKYFRVRSYNHDYNWNGMNSNKSLIPQYLDYINTMVICTRAKM